MRLLAKGSMRFSQAIYMVANLNGAVCCFCGILHMVCPVYRESFSRDLGVVDGCTHRSRKGEYLRLRSGENAHENELIFNHSVTPLRAGDERTPGYDLPEVGRRTRQGRSLYEMWKLRNKAQVRTHELRSAASARQAASAWYGR